VKSELMERSDFVVCSLPGTPETKNFMDSACFESMKPDAVFISIGRGSVVDEDALSHALKTNSIRGAALDVFQEEPLPKSSELWNCENALLTAHNADYTQSYIIDSFRVFERNLRHYENGVTFPTVDIARGY